MTVVYAIYNIRIILIIPSLLLCSSSVCSNNKYYSILVVPNTSCGVTAIIFVEPCLYMYLVYYIITLDSNNIDSEFAPNKLDLT